MIEYLISGAVGAVIGALLRPMIFRSPNSPAVDGFATAMNTIKERAARMNSRTALLVGVADKPGVAGSSKKDMIFAAVDLDTHNLIEPEAENHPSPAGTKIDNRSGQPVLVDKDGAPIPDEIIHCHQVIHFWQFEPGTSGVKPGEREKDPCQCFWSPGGHVHKCW